jgi:hypothetical protein
MTMAEQRQHKLGEVLRLMLQVRFGAISPELAARLEHISAEDFYRYFGRVLSAATVEAVFTEDPPNAPPRVAGATVSSHVPVGSTAGEPGTACGGR